MSKVARQTAVMELVKKENVASQEELRLHLAKRGFRVNQATLSRDIHELGLAKTADGYALPRAHRPPETLLPALPRLLREFLLEVREAQNLLVLKTTVGSAQPVAAALDSQGWPEVVGTIAGDDTILVISSDSKSAKTLATRLREMLA
jgi:transcriptional regulator of arginine metabolism